MSENKRTRAGSNTSEIDETSEPGRDLQLVAFTGTNSNEDEQADRSQRLQQETERLLLNKDRVITRLESEKTRLATEIDYLRNVKTEVAQERDTLRDKNDELQISIDLLNFEKGNLTGENTQLKNDNARLQSDITTLNEEKTTLQNEKGTLQNEKITLQSEINRLKQDLERVTNEKTNLQSEINRLKEENDKSKSKKPVSDANKMDVDGDPIQPAQSNQQSNSLKIVSELVSMYSIDFTLKNAIVFGATSAYAPDVVPNDDDIGKARAVIEAMKQIITLVTNACSLYNEVVEFTPFSKSTMPNGIERISSLTVNLFRGIMDRENWLVTCFTALTGNKRNQGVVLPMKDLDPLVDLFKLIEEKYTQISKEIVPPRSSTARQPENKLQFLQNTYLLYDSALEVYRNAETYINGIIQSSIIPDWNKKERWYSLGENDRKPVTDAIARIKIRNEIVENIARIYNDTYGNTLTPHSEYEKVLLKKIKELEKDFMQLANALSKLRGSSTIEMSKDDAKNINDICGYINGIISTTKKKSFVKMDEVSTKTNYVEKFKGFKMKLEEELDRLYAIEGKAITLFLTRQKFIARENAGTT